MQIEDKPVFIAGDVNGDRPLLHEAADEGRIAGINAVAEKPLAFRRKTPLYITFSDPNIVLVGQRYSELDLDNTLIGSVVLVLVFIFAAWLVTRTLSSLYRGRATELDLLWIGLRASALIAVAIYVVN